MSVRDAIAIAVAYSTSKKAEEFLTLSSCVIHWLHWVLLAFETASVLVVPFSPLAKEDVIWGFGGLVWTNQIFMASTWIISTKLAGIAVKRSQMLGTQKDNTRRRVRNSAAFPLLFDSYKLVIARTPYNLMIPKNSGLGSPVESQMQFQYVLWSSPVLQYSVFQRGATAATDFEQGTI